MKKLNNVIISAKCKLTKKLNENKKGDIAFEYVIILVIMAAVIFFGWNLLGNVVKEKINEIAGALQGITI